MLALAALVASNVWPGPERSPTDLPEPPTAAIGDVGEALLPRAPVKAAPPARAEAPIRARVRRASRWLGGRPGPASFAVIGRDRKLRGVGEHTLYPAASIVKAMLLAAETRRLARAGATLDAGTRGLLSAMITYSDNEAANSIYARVGDQGLFAVANRAGMADFDVAGHWGNAAVSAADMALLFDQLDRVIPGRFERYAKGLLGSVIEPQRWGIPAAAPSLSVRFKGGWRPTELGQLVNQAGELRDRRRKLAIAVLSDGQPSMEVGIETIEGVTVRLLGRRGGG